MSSDSHEKFPISLLQRSQKITSEPPRGLWQNMMRMYANMPEIRRVREEASYRKSLFGLAWYHALLIEWKKFKTLGYNVVYKFNDSDFNVCSDLLATYMGAIDDDNPEIPIRNKDKNLKNTNQINWQALQFLISEANYGGRVTDDFDRLLIKTYAIEIFKEELIKAEWWKPPNSNELNYQYPDESTIKGAADATSSPYDP